MTNGYYLPYTLSTIFMFHPIVIQFYRTSIQIHCFIVFSACDCDEVDPCDHGTCYCETGSSDALCCCDGTGYKGDECDERGKFGDIYIILHHYYRYQQRLQTKVYLNYFAI